MSVNSGQFKKGIVPKTAFKKGCIGVNKGRTFSKEWRQNLSNAKKGKDFSKMNPKWLKENKPEVYEKWYRNLPRGEKHPAWKGGITSYVDSVRNSMDYKAWREAVFSRDNFTCQDCGDNKGGNLQAHHLKPFSEFPELRFAIDNGTTLCIPCHMKTDSFGGKQTYKYKTKVKVLCQ